MADNVNIKLDADITSFLARMKQAEKALKRFKREQAKQLAATSSGLSSGGGGVENFEKRLDKTFTKMKRHFDGFDKGVKMMGTGLLKFLGVAIKGTILQMGLMAASMLVIHAAFGAGNIIMKGYAGAMKLVAGAAAAAAIAISTAAAAVREQQAAMFAYKGGGFGEFGSGLNQTRVAMRSFAADANLAGLGSQNLQKAYAAMSKTMNSAQISGSRKLFTSAMDFGSAGQDPGAAAAKVGELIATLNDAKKGLAEVQTAAKAVGPEMEQAIKDSKIKSKEQFREMLLSGELAKKGGVAGQFAAVNSTLIGQAKTFFGLIKAQFADFGQQFLEPAKVAMQKIFKIIKTDLIKVSGELQAFGTGTFFDGIVTVTEKLSGFFVKLIREWLPQTQGIFGRIGDWMREFKYGWDQILERLRPFIEGAKVIEDALKPILKAIGTEGANAFKEFNNQLMLNKDNVQELGDRLGELLTSFFKMTSEFKRMFFDALPFINDMVKGLTQVFDMLRGVLAKFTSSNAVAGLMGFAIMARQMKGTKGGFLPGGNMQTMNVGTLNVQNAPGITPSGQGAGGSTPQSKGGRGRMPGTTPQAGYPVSPLPAAGYGALVLKQFRTPDSQGLQSGGAGAIPPAAGGRYQRFLRGVEQRGGAPIPVMERFNRGMDAVKNKDFAGMAINAKQSVKNLGIGAKVLDTKLSMPAVGMLGPDLSYGGQYKIDPDTRLPVTDADGRYITSSRITGREKTMDPNRVTNRMRRSGRLGSAILGNERAGITGVNNTMGARMGAGIGLSMMSQYAPEEMRGAMALGGMVGSFNPLAGLAIAGVGGAMKGQSPLAGGLAGAAGGAALGTMIAPGIGTAIGAAIGGIGGVLMGQANKLKAQAKAARETMGASLDGIGQVIMNESSKQLLINRELQARGIEIKGPGAFEGIGETYRGRLSGVSESVNKARDMGATDKTSYARNIGGSALAGAGYGALVGTIGGPVGMAIGAAMGTIGGAFIGGLVSLGDKFQGMLRGDNRKAKAQTAAIQKIYDEQKQLGIDISEEQLKAMMKDKEAALTKFQNQFAAESKATEMLDRTYSARLDELQKVTGKTRPELELMAKTLGVNLYDSTVKYKDLLEQLGLSIEKTAAQMRQANTDAFVEGASGYTKAIEQLRAPLIYNEIAAGLSKALDAGASEIQILESMEQLSGATLSATGGDPIAAYFDRQAQFGTKAKPGKAFGVGGALEGQQDKFFTGRVDEINQNVGTRQLTGFAENAAGQLSSKLSARGFSVDAEALKGEIIKMDPAKQEKLLTDLQSGTFDFRTLAKRGTFQEQAKTQLESAGIGNIARLAITERPEAKLDEAATAMTTATGEFKIAVEKFVTAAGVAFAPESFDTQTLNTATLNVKGVPFEGDTRSPRGKGVGDTTSSRLSQTMARHASIDGALSGKRTVTSSYRTFALGSPSSDHVNGRAIDLVGANLGQYKSMAEANGGFAEFHGRGASRHLHVVPGPGPMGDTMSPVGMGSRTNAPSASGGGGGNSYTININGSNASPEEIANKVMARIKDNERARRER